ncbi:MAG: hypothetical protein KGL39_41815 [Patescibacteria group bacterium]|nr:hypothetical protein [Patescibacteria group bacterium]
MNFLTPFKNLPNGCLTSDVEGMPEEEVATCSACGLETVMPDDFGRCFWCNKKDRQTLKEQT